MIRGVDQTARRHRFHLLLSSSHNDRVEIEAALQAMWGRVDGLLVMSPDLDTQRLKANLPDGLPVLLLNCSIDDGRLHLLNIDNVGGVRAMVRHLREHGHQRIAVIKGSARNFDASERLRGYRMAVQEDGGFWSEALEIPGDFTKSAGYAGARRVLAMTPRPTVIFAFNDSMAIGALSALREAGVRVPEEMAVVGFDDIPMAQYVTPALTSVHVPIFEMGARAVERLIEALQRPGDAPGTCEVLPTRLVIRASCGLTHHQMSS